MAYDEKFRDEVIKLAISGEYTIRELEAKAKVCFGSIKTWAKKRGVKIKLKREGVCSRILSKEDLVVKVIEQAPLGVMSVAAFARQNGVYPHFIWSILKDLALLWKRPGRNSQTPEKEAEIRKLHAAGWTNDDLARYFHISKQGVSDRLRTMGLIPNRAKLKEVAPVVLEEGVDKYRAGASIYDAAKGITNASYLREILLERGLLREPKAKPVGWDTEKAIELRKQGYTYSQIAEVVGVSANCVNTYIRNNVLLPQKAAEILHLNFSDVYGVFRRGAKIRPKGKEYFYYMEGDEIIVENGPNRVNIANVLWENIIGEWEVVE